jgi:hypothetical protein
LITFILRNPWSYPCPFSVSPILQFCLLTVLYRLRINTVLPAPVSEKYRPPEQAIGSEDLNFDNATKIDPDQNISDSRSVYSLSSHHCPHFSLLDDFLRCITTMGTVAPCDAFQADTARFEEAKAD